MLHTVSTDNWSPRCKHKEETLTSIHHSIPRSMVSIKKSMALARKYNCRCKVLHWVFLGHVWNRKIDEIFLCSFLFLCLDEVWPKRKFLIIWHFLLTWEKKGNFSAHPLKLGNFLISLYYLGIEISFLHPFKNAWWNDFTYLPNKRWWIPPKCFFIQSKRKADERFRGFPFPYANTNMMMSPC